MERVVYFSFSLVFVLLCNAADVRDPSSTWPYKSIVCQSCMCVINKSKFDIDCSGRNLTTFFKYEEWPQQETYIDEYGVMDLSGNLFVNITVIPELPIRVLNLSRNRIERIESGSFKSLKRLRVLDLSHNMLSGSAVNAETFLGSQYAIYPWIDIETLNLDHNNIDALGLILFKYTHILTELNLSNNPLRLLEPKTVEERIIELKRLKVLRMSSCALHTIPDWFLVTMVSLEQLDISDNHLMVVPQQLGAFKNLLFLNIGGHNDIFELDSSNSTAFPRMPKLEELHMCNMPNLRYIGENALGGLESLVRLHMSHNPKLIKIDYRAFKKQSISNYPPIRELYLQSNKISQLDSRLIRWEFLERVDLSDNPYLCDCSTPWMIDDLATIVDRTGNSSLMICQEPVNMRGYSLKYLHDTFSPIQLFCAKC